jgi:hypothetical protein
MTKWNRVIPGFLSSLLLAGCGGSDGQSKAIPPAAATMSANLKTGMARSVQRLAGYEAGLVFALNPGSPLSSNISIAPDGTPGAPPFSYVFSGPYDGNQDGYEETTLNGKASFVSDPASAWDGIDGQATINAQIPGGLHGYAGQMHFTFTPTQGQVYGTGTFSVALGDQTSLTIDPAKPLVIKPATGLPGAVDNACGYSVEGDLHVDVTGSSGSYSSDWSFTSSQPNAAVSGATFTDTGGMTTNLPNSSVKLDCGSGGSINDWAGTYTQNWSCFPQESGQATLTLAVNGANSISVTDEDPPGSGNIDVYPATVLGASPHVVKGFFIGGPPGNTYREDFIWTLGLDGRFTQISSYVYQEGPQTGHGGFCVASAKP